MLIACPECGKEKVSDTAKSCPECGYAIKDHFAKIKEEEDAKTQQEKVKDMIKNIEKSRLNNIQMPTESKFPKGWLIVGLFLILLSVFCIIMGAIEDGQAFIVVGNLISGVVCLVIGNNKFVEAKEKYAKAKLDFEQYKRDEIQRQDIEREKEMTKLKNTPICPTCGSADVKAIGTVNRAISVAAVGLASGKIGKQFECKDCGYKW